MGTATQLAEVHATPQGSHIRPQPSAAAIQTQSQEALPPALLPGGPPPPPRAFSQHTSRMRAGRPGVSRGKGACLGVKLCPPPSTPSSLGLPPQGPGWWARHPSCHTGTATEDPRNQLHRVCQVSEVASVPCPGLPCAEPSPAWRSCAPCVGCSPVPTLGPWGPQPAPKFPPEPCHPLTSHHRSVLFTVWSLNGPRHRAGCRPRVPSWETSAWPR